MDTSTHILMESSSITTLDTTKNLNSGTTTTTSDMDNYCSKDGTILESCAANEYCDYNHSDRCSECEPICDTRFFNEVYHKTCRAFCESIGDSPPPPPPPFDPHPTLMQDAPYIPEIPQDIPTRSIDREAFAVDNPGSEVPLDYHGGESALMQYTFYVMCCVVLLFVVFLICVVVFLCCKSKENSRFLQNTKPNLNNCENGFITYAGPATGVAQRIINQNNCSNCSTRGSQTALATPLEASLQHLNHAESAIFIARNGHAHANGNGTMFEMVPLRNGHVGGQIGGQLLHTQSTNEIPRVALNRKPSCSNSVPIDTHDNRSRTDYDVTETLLAHETEVKHV